MGIAASHAAKIIQSTGDDLLKISQLSKQPFYSKAGKSRHKAHLQWTGNRSMMLSSVRHSGSREWPALAKSMDPE